MDSRERNALDYASCARLQRFDSTRLTGEIA